MNIKNRENLKFTFPTGGDIQDKMLTVIQWFQLWDYNTGEVTHVGAGHSAAITTISFSPDKKYIVSVSADGAIFVWIFPPPVIKTDDERLDADLERELKIEEKREMPSSPCNTDDEKPFFKCDSEGIP